MYKPETTKEIALQLCFTVITNASMIPGSILCWKLGLPMDTVISSFAILTSVLYHGLELTTFEVLGGNSIKWHIADNVFASSAFCIAALNFIQFTSPYIVLDGLKTLALCVNIICQIISPWDFRYTFFPIMISVLLIGCYLLIKRRSPHVSKPWLLVAVAAFPSSMLCFVWGLDSDHDILKFYHGLWHLGVSGFMYAVMRAANPHTVVSTRLEAHKKAHSHFLSELHSNLSAGRRHYKLDDDKEGTSVTSIIQLQDFNEDSSLTGSTSATDDASMTMFTGRSPAKFIV